jgi:hypothetical protein
MFKDQFLNPVKEEVENDDDDLINSIVHAYSKEERAYETDEKDVIQRRITFNKAISALQTLRLFEEQQDEGDNTLILCLNKHKRLMENRKMLKQITITSYFT